MKYVLPTLLLLVVCWSLDGVAEERPYWLVGSFKAHDNAIQERNRIARAINRPVQIVPFDGDGGRFHRLVVPVDMSLGLPGYDVHKLWVIKLDIADMPATPAPPRATSRDTYLVAASFGASDKAQAMLDDLQIMWGTVGTVREVACQRDSCLLSDNTRKVKGTDFYRVLIGPLSDSASIAAAQRMLEEIGITGAWSYKDCVICANWPGAVNAVAETDPASAPRPDAGNQQAPQTIVSTIPPVEYLSLVEDLSPVEDVSPVEGLSPVEDVSPVEGLSPVEDVCPVKDVSPVENLSLVEDLSPVEDLSTASTQPARAQLTPRPTHVKKLTYLEFCMTLANKLQRRLYCRNGVFEEKLLAGQLKLPFEAGPAQLTYLMN